MSVLPLIFILFSFGIGPEITSACKSNSAGSEEAGRQRPNSILIVTGSCQSDLTSEVINTDQKQCAKKPPQYPNRVLGATGGFVDGIAIICGGFDYDTYKVITECYALKRGGDEWIPLAQRQVLT